MEDDHVEHRCGMKPDKKRFSRPVRSRRGVHELGVAATEDALEESSDATDEDIQVLTVQIRNVSKNQDWTVAGDLAGHPTELKVDTGAQANILPYSYFRRMRLPTMASALQAPDPGKEFILATDASDYAVGACLAQQDLVGKERPIRFLSTPLSKGESTADNGDRKVPLPNPELVAGQDPRVAGSIMDIIQNVKKIEVSVDYIDRTMTEILERIKVCNRWTPNEDQAASGGVRRKSP
ncbi:hypothetical protein MRX96_047677 [Rhipicephalus microplus]